MQEPMFVFGQSETNEILTTLKKRKFFGAADQDSGERDSGTDVSGSFASFPLFVE
jgi:hypothetical protein